MSVALRPRKTTGLIGRTCKGRDVLSEAVLMVKSRDHFDRTPSNVVLHLDNALGALSMAGLFQQIDTRPFTGLQVSPNLSVWTLRARIARTSRFALQSIVHD